MSRTLLHPTPSTLTTVPRRPALDELVAVGWELNANQHRTVRLAARYDDELDWFHQGLKNAATGIARELQIHSSTASEWIRVGHSLRHLPLIDAAFAANTISYAKARILTRWADADNEQELLDLAIERTANRLTTAIAQLVAATETDEERDQRHFHDRGVTSHINGEGMLIVRMALEPAIGKAVLAGVDEFVRQIAATPMSTDTATSGEESPADDREQHQSPERTENAAPRALTGSAEESSADDLEEANFSGLNANGPIDTLTWSGEESSADDREHQGSPERNENTSPSTLTGSGEESSADDSEQQANTPPLADTLKELRQRWQPGADDDWHFPTLAQQRADAFAALFLRMDIALTTEVIIHVRGDGNTFDDGTPITTNAITRQLDQSFIRFTIHDSERRPIDATNRRRFPTPRQKRVALETHNHECVDCQTTDLLEMDHNPPFEQTRHTITTELEPRCTGCHRARHRTDA